MKTFDTDIGCTLRGKGHHLQVNGVIGRGVRLTYLDEDGNLCVEMTDGARLNLGKVIPRKGVDYFDGLPGEDGRGIQSSRITTDGELVVLYTTGEVVNLGRVVGRDGDPGEDGVGIQSAAVDAAGDLVVQLTTGQELNVGHVRGELNAEQTAQLDGALQRTGGAMTGAITFGEGAEIYHSGKSLLLAAEDRAAGIVLRRDPTNGEAIVDVQAGHIGLDEGQIYGLRLPMADDQAASKYYVDTVTSRKQDKMFAGDGITFTPKAGGVIVSATGGGGLTPEQAEKLENAATLQDVADAVAEKQDKIRPPGILPGQFIRVKNVSDDGDITEWEPADMPIGRPIYDAYITTRGSILVDLGTEYTGITVLQIVDDHDGAISYPLLYVADSTGRNIGSTYIMQSVAATNGVMYLNHVAVLGGAVQSMGRNGASTTARNATIPTNAIRFLAVSASPAMDAGYHIRIYGTQQEG